MEVARAGEMGPERILPNAEEELGQERISDGGVLEGGGEWSGEEPEEEEEGAAEEEEEEDGGGYYYQPLNQDPESGQIHPSLPDQPEGPGSLSEELQDVQDRIQAMGLYLPQPPPPDSDEEDEPEGAAALQSNSSIPMDDDHVELVKRTMAAVNLPSLGIPPWAREISDDQWKDMVQQTLQTRQASAGLKLDRK
ncbi:male-enhanced antigen 1 isoform X1 [Amia ocellicauda]|uniref:male-enhanced antigen 1 isoform X1 n=1 Tax=Amia ocellicauda TaxID=2972642 RepID=UPI003463E2D5